MAICFRLPFETFLTLEKTYLSLNLTGEQRKIWSDLSFETKSKH